MKGTDQIVVWFMPKVKIRALEFNVILKNESGLCGPGIAISCNDVLKPIKFSHILRCLVHQ